LLRIVEGIDEATLQGFELDASWQLSDTLRFDAGYSNINGEIKKMSVRPYVAGNEVPNAADFTANMALTWDQDLNNGLNLIARLESAYQGDIFYHVIQGSDLDSPRSFDAIVGPEAGLEYEVPAVLQLGGLATSYGKTKVDGYGIANLRIGLASDNWRVTAFAKNLTDESYVAEVITAVEFGGAFIHPGRERMMGVELEYSF
jgi:iron complex outermembrane receptor protein